MHQGRRPPGQAPHRRPGDICLRCLDTSQGRRGRESNSRRRKTRETAFETAALTRQRSCVLALGLRSRAAMPSRRGPGERLGDRTSRRFAPETPARPAADTARERSTAGVILPSIAHAAQARRVTSSALAHARPRRRQPSQEHGAARRRRRPSGRLAFVAARPGHIAHRAAGQTDVDRLLATI